MKTDSLLKWTGIAFLVYLGGNWLYEKVYSKIEFDTPRIHLGQLQWSGPLPIGVAATIDIPLTNNNPVSFPVQRLLANIVYGQYVLSSLMMMEPLTIRAGETTVLQFDTYLSFVDLGGNIASIISSGEYLQALKIVGSADVEGVTIPFSNTISVG